jgi:hypothetical protein
VTQEERLVARIVEWSENNPGKVMHLTVIVDASGRPFCWWISASDEKVEGLPKLQS